MIYWRASGPCGAVLLGFLRGLTGLAACALLVKEGSSLSTSMSESEFGWSLLSESERDLFRGEEAGVAGWEWYTSRKVSLADWKISGDFEGDGTGEGLVA